ncbi:hypothetical protein GCM10009430_12490 [Aquimarina litoralis]|uniref:Uncharacterized protein n=1 Tax=Aquimarina litoralis TaxID=584605 RepID=A0ABP3TVY0_9FLAO
MRLDISHTFSSKHNDIVLIATEYDEPNYGRFHWKYQFLINNTLVENQHMNYKYGGLFGNLNNFCLESKDGNHIFLPLEKNPLIYEPNEDNYFEISDVATGKNNGFLKNIFIEDKLFILCQRSVQIVNLINKRVQSILFPVNQFQLEDMEYNQKLLISYLNLKDSNKSKGYYDFESMNFKDIQS